MTKRRLQTSIDRQTKKMENLLCQLGRAFFVVAVISILGSFSTHTAGAPLRADAKRDAYATMVYMGTPRDYEFYTAARVMLQTLARFKVDADLVVIASQGVPTKWRRTL